jgi:hypothetical protein
MFDIANEEIYAKYGFSAPFLLRASVDPDFEFIGMTLRDFFRAQHWVHRSRHAWTPPGHDHDPVPTERELRDMQLVLGRAPTAYMEFVKNPRITVQAVHAKFPDFPIQKLERIRRSIDAALSGNPEKVEPPDHPKGPHKIIKSHNKDSYSMLTSVLEDLERTKSPFTRGELIRALGIQRNLVYRRVFELISAGKISNAGQTKGAGAPDLLIFV